MATKRTSSAKKSSKKSKSKKATKAAAALPINLRCIEACVQRYNACLKKGVAQATCIKRLQRCIGACAGGIFPTDE